METTAWGFWLPIVINLLFWLVIVAGISYMVARWVVRRELTRQSFVGTEPERRDVADLPPPEL